MEVTLTLHFASDQEQQVDQLITENQVIIKSSEKQKGDAVIVYTIVFTTEYGPYFFGHAQASQSFDALIKRLYYIPE